MKHFVNCFSNTAVAILLVFYSDYSLAKTGTTLPPAKASVSQPADVPAFGFERSVLILAISKREIDIDSPWRFKDSTNEKHLGIYIGNGRILTTAFAVLNSTLIEMKKFGQPVKTPVKLDFVDFECNLALLKTEEEGSFSDMTPMKLGQDLSLSTEAWILNERNSTQLIRNATRLVEVNVVNTTTSSLSLPSYMMKVQQEGLGWSEPVVRGQDLVGLTTGQDANHVYAIPASVILHFIEDHQSGNYRGFPGLGFDVRPLIDPNLRSFLKATGVVGGIYVKEIHEGSPASKVLNPLDVLIELDGVALSEDGTYRHPDWGRMNLYTLLSNKRGGDLVEMKIVRAGAPMNVQVPLTRLDSNSSLIIFDRYDSFESHVIFGGFIFQELSRDFLREWGREWQNIAPLDLLYLWETQNKTTQDRRRKIILNRVLADEYNQGYERLQNLTLATVNGQTVYTIEQLKEALKKPLSANGKLFAVFQFDRAGGEVVLSYESVDEAQMRIAKTYSINSPASFYYSH